MKKTFLVAKVNVDNLPAEQFTTFAKNFSNKLNEDINNGKPVDVLISGYSEKHPDGLIKFETIDLDLDNLTFTQADGTKVLPVLFEQIKEEK